VLLLTSTSVLTYVSPAATASVKRSAPSTLQEGTQQVSVHWISKKTGAVFTGKIGRLSIQGVSVQPQPYKANFTVTGKLGTQKFNVKISMKSLNASGITFAVAGTVGTAVLRGTANETLNPSGGSGAILLTGVLGKTPISGTIPLSAGIFNGVRGTVKVG